MIDKIKQILIDSGLMDSIGEYYYEKDNWESVVSKFAELIIKECVELGKELQTQDVINGSEDYKSGREMGIEVFMNQIKKNFGVE